MKHRWLPDVVLLLSLPLVAFLSIPLASLLLRTPLDRMPANLVSQQVVQAVTLSFSTSSIATLLTVAFGAPLAYFLARRRYRWRRVLDTLLDLPMVLPPAVAGVALLMAFGRRGVVGALLADLGITIAFTPVAVVVAQMFVAAPLFVKSARVGFSSVGGEIIEAAHLDGANGWQVFRYVFVPLTWTALLSGGVMTWARALGEFGATIIFAGNYPGRTQTMPLAIYLGFELDLNIALTLSIILVGLSFFVLLVVRGFLHRDPEAGFI